MSRIFAFVLFVIFSLNATAQTTRPDYSDALRLIDVWLDAQKDFARVPGISVAIVQNQDIIFKKGYGFADVERKVPMKPETLFSICSISKLFTSIAIMQLWEQGKLRLDDSLQALLPDYMIRQRYAQTVPITVQSLLTHSSGLIRDADSSWNPPNFYFLTTDELKKSLITEETLYPASTYFQYSNVGMSLLGEIVQRKSGKAYNDYIEENILRPLQLSNTHPYLPEKLWRTEMATGYSALTREGNRKMQPLFKTNAITPAAGFSSNVLDLARFASWQLRLLSADKPEVLRPSTLKEMQRIHWASPDKRVTWGLGFLINYDPSNVARIGHDGSCPGYVSVVAIEPKKKLGITVMINAQGVDVYSYSNQLFNLLNKNITVDTAARNVDLSVYEGRYDSYTWSGEVAVIAVKGKLLTMNLPSGSPADAISEYRYIKKDTFRRIRPDDGSLGEELVFERDGNGQVKSFRVHSLYRNKIGKL
ncbi:MAG TPA: serine hydrolase domain-containing protein [Chitinophagaceae bacterium]|nr:serine hydrolase domain-containing protein [Chitinophagaceae bacterium]